MDTEETPLNFRLLPAYRKHKRAAVALAETVAHDSRRDTSSQDGEEQLPADVEIVSADDTQQSSSSSSSSTLATLKKPSVSKVLRSNRKRKCLELCKRVAAFLLSTLGLTVLTVLYAVAGGYLFSALESQNVETVKSGVKDALQWHVDALWNSTAQLNVLHPVTDTNSSVLFCFVSILCRATD